MSNEFTAVYERDGEWFIGYCSQVAGANGQGKTLEECRESLIEAIRLILDDRREQGLAGIPQDAIARRSRFDEAGGPPAAPSPIRLRAQAGRLRPLAVDQPTNGSVEAVPRHVEIPDRLAINICDGLAIPRP